MTRTQWCRDHLDEIAENCRLSKSETRRIARVNEFIETHPENVQICTLSTDALGPLIRIEDPEIQAKAIEAVERRMAETGQDKLTRKEVQETIAIFVPVNAPAIDEPEPAIAPAPMPRSGALTYNKRSKIHILQTHLMDEMGDRYTKDVYRFEKGASEEAAKQALADFNAGGSKVLDILLLDAINSLLDKGFARSEILTRLAVLAAG